MSEEAFYVNPEFWVAIAFGVFLVLVFRPVGRIIGKALDTRSAEVASQLAEARRLRDEAQALLELYRKKQQESLQEARDLLERARQDSERMTAHAEAELKASLDKRMKTASDRIAQSETKALQEVQSHVVDIAIAAARSLISEHLSRTGGKDLIHQAATELERKLH